MAHPFYRVTRHQLKASIEGVNHVIKTSLQVGLVGLIIIFVWAMINGVDLAYQVAMLLFTLASLASLFWLQKNRLLNWLQHLRIIT